ncbi:Fatty acid desaturase [Popillia japonica]|uniref:Fatty acid desaturase n=1 Tax=Popillia japonica TaxID=7064 RepID=A0AAW1LX33_POPJA
MLVIYRFKDYNEGTDITEAFEAHHISTIPEKLLPLYFVRKATTPRNSPFTFEEDGFYKTLKARVRKDLEDVPKQPEKRSKNLADILFISFMVTSWITVRDESYIMGFLSGLFLTMTCIAAHNFFHQRDNFRMYYFDFTMMSSRNWRISHALSHHIYTNTVYDLEISSLEPFLQYLPTKKNYIIRYGSWLYSPIFYAFIYLGNYLSTIFQAIIEKSSLRWENGIPLFHLLFLYLCSGRPLIATLTFYTFIIIVSSFFFGVIGLNAGHHHPDLFHDGDDVRSSPKIDWGLHQMDSVMDRSEITGSHFLVLITFGDHALHHLFPTIDHGRLNYLYPIFQNVCTEFGIEIKMSTQIDLTVGQFQQLSKMEPTKRRINI